MTSFFRSVSSQPTVPAEKRNVNSFSSHVSKSSNGSNGHFPRRVKNFFRISSLSGNHSGGGSDGSSAKSESKPFRQSRFLPNLGRHRSTTVASEGNPMDEALSPTALANPYFAHQGPPALRHHNDGSVPPSPTGTPDTIGGGGADSSGTADPNAAARKEEIARKLRRVASAPNAQGLFADGESTDRPATAGVPSESTLRDGSPSGLSVNGRSGVKPIPVPIVSSSPDGPAPSGLPRHALAFRRTYSSNSIKVRNVEVGPASFDKIKLIGKGDVGKVYLSFERRSQVDSTP